MLWCHHVKHWLKVIVWSVTCKNNYEIFFRSTYKLLYTCLTWSFILPIFSTFFTCNYDNWASTQKTCLLRFVNNKGADQPAHPHSLISAFVFVFCKVSYPNLLQAKFPLSSLSSLVCISLCRKPRRQVFSRRCLYNAWPVVQELTAPAK